MKLKKTVALLFYNINDLLTRIALFLFPDSHVNQLNLCKKYIRKKEWDKAIAKYQDILSTNRYKYYANYGIAHCYMQKQNYKKAQEYVEKAISILPDDIDARSLLANALIQQNKYQETIEQLEKIIKLAPKKTYAYEQLSYIYYTRGDFEALAKILNQAVNTYHIRTPYILYYFAYGNEMTGKKDVAISVYKEMLKKKNEKFKALAKTRIDNLECTASVIR